MSKKEWIFSVVLSIMLVGVMLSSFIMEIIRGNTGDLLLGGTFTVISIIFLLAICDSKPKLICNHNWEFVDEGTYQCSICQEVIRSTSSITNELFDLMNDIESGEYEHSDGWHDACNKAIKLLKELKERY